MLPCFTLLLIRYMIIDILAVNIFIQCAFTLHSNTKQSSISDKKIVALILPSSVSDFHCTVCSDPTQMLSGLSESCNTWRQMASGTVRISAHTLYLCIFQRMWTIKAEKKKNPTLLNRTPRTSNEANTGKFLVIPIPGRVSHHAEHWLSNSSWWDHHALILTAKSL